MFIRGSAFDTMKAGNGTVNKIGIVTDDNGNMKFFAELEKTSKKSPYEKEEKESDFFQSLCRSRSL